MRADSVGARLLQQRLGARAAPDRRAAGHRAGRRWRPRCRTPSTCLTPTCRPSRRWPSAATPACCAPAAWATWRCWCSPAASMPTRTARADGMKGAIRTLAALGVQVLVQTNAAGSLDAGLRPGELMLVSDHINVRAALAAVRREPADQRFVDMSAAYDPALARAGPAAAARAGIAAARRRLCLGAGPAVRDAGRDPHAAQASARERWA